MADPLQGTSIGDPSPRSADVRDASSLQGGAIPEAPVLGAQSRRTMVDPPDAPASRRIWPWITIAVLISFLLGLIGSPWFEASVRSQLPPALRYDAATAPRINTLEARISQLEAVLVLNPAEPAPSASTAAGAAQAATRIAALESQAAALQAIDAGTTARLDALAADLLRTSGAAEAGDRQVRELFLLAVTRRMLESGRSLAPIEPALDARFGAADRSAVDALASWSRVPQTRATLAARLQGPGFGATTAATGDTLWARLKARLSGLITVGDTAAPGTIDPGAVQGALQAIQAGDLVLATSRLQRAPPGDARDQWIADANTLIAAEAGLDRLEASLVQSAVAQAPVMAAPPPVNAAAAP